VSLTVGYPLAEEPDPEPESLSPAVQLIEDTDCSHAAGKIALLKESSLQVAGEGTAEWCPPEKVGAGGIPSVFKRETSSLSR
jgi:hypothetical protein